MKNIFFLLAMIFMHISGWPQTTVQSIGADDIVKLKDGIIVTPAVLPGILRDGRLESAGTITLNGASFDLGNITIRAKTITLPAALTQFSITGSVKLECETLVLAGATRTIICTGEGSLSFIFKTVTNTNNCTIAQNPSVSPKLSVGYARVN